MTENSLEHNCRKLERIRKVWCRRPRSRYSAADRTNITIVLNGLHVTDIPTFFIVLGEAVNGPGGYYGGCLDALEDCLCGDFGLRPPFTLEVIGLEQIRAALNASEDAWYQRLRKRWVKEEWYDDSESPVQDLSDPYYFNSLMEIFTRRQVTVREYGQQ